MVSPRTADDVVAGIDLTGRTCVITGATSGLGLASARALARTGVRLVLAGRDTEKLAQVATEITADTGAEVHPVELDLTSLASVRTAGAVISEISPSIHILVNNAGVMFTPLQRTADGFEMQFGTNHLGHFELTRILMPQLINADGARVVTLTSEGHRLADVDLDDPNWNEREYDKFAAYGASKTANILHAVELDRRLSNFGVRAYAVHPGVVSTALVRHMTKDDYAALGGLSTTGNTEPKDAAEMFADIATPERGASTQVWAATTTELEDGGLYLFDCAIRAAAPYAVDRKRATRLWELSEELCSA